MTRRPLGWFGLVLMIALTVGSGCNLSDPITFVSGDACETDGDCGNGACVEQAGARVCECDEFFEGSSCDRCVEGRALNDDGECVKEDEITPDMGMMDEPCITVTPDPLAFGEIEVGRAAVLTATITNCSEGFDLTIDDVTTCLDDAGGDCAASPIFDVDTVTPELPATLEPGATASARVRFVPEAGASTGRLDVTAGELSASVALTGSGTGADCVEINAQGRTMAEPTWADDLATSPYETVELRALVSSGPAGSIQTYEWSVTAQPTGSNARLLPDETAAMPTFFVDTPGDYVIEVTTYNGNDEPSCDPAVVNVTAAINADVFVDVTWDTPNDPDQMDNMGADVDLHMLHSNGMWDLSPWDVFVDNASPDWGTLGDTTDDPRLVRSDSDGMGPEFIVLNNPENVIYRVGAYCRNPNGFGPSDVTMRVYIGGTLTYTGTATIALREFWFAGSISWANLSFNIVDQVTIGFP